MAMLRMLGHDVHSNCAQERFARWLGRLRPLDYAGVGRAVARWQPYAGLVYFQLLLDRIIADRARWNRRPERALKVFITEPGRPNFGSR